MNRKFIIDREYFLEKAIDHCEEALRINPSYRFAHDNLGNIYHSKGNYPKARNSFSNALLYSPAYPEAKNDLAMLYLEPEYEDFSLKKAEELHQEALALLDKVKDEKQLTKLKDAFNKRKDGLT